MMKTTIGLLLLLSGALLGGCGNRSSSDQTGGFNTEGTDTIQEPLYQNDNRSNPVATDTTMDSTRRP